MAKRILSIIGLLILSTLFTGVLIAAAPGPGPQPNVTFTLVSGLPSTMNVGDTATVVVQVESDQQFLYAQMLPTFHFPGRGLMATNMGGDRAHDSTSATLEITFVAKNSTADLPDEGVCPTAGVAPVAFFAGVRYPGGVIVAQRFPETGFYCITVP
ncbi:MAG TPA: hypothetical protein VHM28_05820 [Anaerolineales bacterium]|jgi:hypothetical protein|nr:hypothetical protein [Anaerolineales bacterium]